MHKTHKLKRDLRTKFQVKIFIDLKFTLMLFQAIYLYILDGLYILFFISKKLIKFEIKKVIKKNNSSVIQPDKFC